MAPKKVEGTDQTVEPVNPNHDDSITPTHALEVVHAEAPAVYDPQRQSALFSLGTMSDAEFAAHAGVINKGLERIRDLQRQMLTKGTDYDTLEGTGDRVVLLKPGAEKLASFASLVPVFRRETIIEEVPGHMDRITCTTDCDLHYGSAEGPTVGSGVGVCSNYEKKYRWRNAKPVCPVCGKDTIGKSKSEFYCWRKVGGCGETFPLNDERITSQKVGQVENDDPYEQINTIVKMSEKRAHVDATIRSLNASSLFTQDVGEAEPQDDYAPQAAPRTRNRASSPQRGSQAPSRSSQPSRAASDYKQQDDPPGWEFDGRVAKPISPEPSAPEMPHADEPAQASPAPGPVGESAGSGSTAPPPTLGVADPKVQEAVFSRTPEQQHGDALVAAMGAFDTGRMSGERGTKAVIEGAVRSIGWAEKGDKKYLSLVVLSSEGQDVHAVMSEALASQLKLIDPRSGFTIDKGSIVGISGEWKHLPDGPTLALSGLTS